jgi:hypothetical protein
VPAETTSAAILLAFGTGLISAGIIGNVMHLMTGRMPELSALDDEDLFTPLRLVGLVVAAPWLLFQSAFWWLIAKPPVAIPVMLAAIVWSTLQGVFILTQVFDL